ncbi:hypothetical protein [Treponema zioleckii]|nr:hypothetical protein [Treponema zioleckii]
MLFGLGIFFAIMVSVFVFSLLGITIDNLGDKVIEKIDKSREE